VSPFPSFAQESSLPARTSRRCRPAALAGAALLTLLALSLAPPSHAQLPAEPVDCAGPAPAAEPGTPEYLAVDAANIYCTQERHLDQAQNPLAALPTGSVIADAYREPSRHDGVRFRFDETTLDGLAVEVYRPCAAGTCPDLPEGLRTYEAPYPAVITFHGGASNKALHWWSSQTLAEAGYLVLSYDSAGVAPVDAEAELLTDWLFDRTDPLTRDFDGERLGIAGHSAGGVLVSRFGQADERVDAVVSWDRAQSTVQPTDPPVRTPSLFMFADYNCQRSPVCQPEPSSAPPDPEGPGTKGQDFQLLRAAGMDTMQIGLRAALHLDWTPSEPSGNRYAELMSVWYTTAWFDRYVKGPTEPAVAAEAFERLTAEVYDDFADRRNISQGFYDPAAALAAGDPYAGNVPYALAGMRAVDRLSFRHRSKCFVTDPSTGDRAESEDLRVDPCAVTAASAVPPAGAEPPPPPSDDAPGTAPSTLPVTGGGPPAAALLLLLAGTALRLAGSRGQWLRRASTSSLLLIDERPSMPTWRALSSRSDFDQSS
jgi:hypothetical protein